MEQAKEISERVEDLVVNEVIAALCDLERETVVEAARQMCCWCMDGIPMADDHEHFTPMRTYGRCNAVKLWSRWPDYVPNAEEGKR